MLKNWVKDANSDNRLPLVLTSASQETLDKHLKNRRLFRTPEYEKLLEEKFRSQNLTLEVFKKSYPYITLSESEKDVHYIFFAKDGMFLFSSSYSENSLPSYDIIQEIKSSNDEYVEFQKTGNSKRPLLFWPLKAHDSGLFFYALNLLEKIDLEKLTRAEKKAYFELRKIIHLHPS